VAEADQLGTTNEIVLTGTRLRGALQDRPSAAKVMPDEELGATLKTLQAAARKNDRKTIVGLAALPLRVNSPSGTVTYRDRESVMRDFDQIFTPAVRRAMSEGRPGSRFELGRSCAEARCLRITAVTP
jgi:hypothetical protein